MKKFIKFSLVAGAIIIALWFLRIHILWGVGRFLIYEDGLQKADAIFVLGGSSFERGTEAAKIYKDGFSEKIICTGANIPSALQAVNIEISESEVTRRFLIHNTFAAKEDIISLAEGTSTKEESEAIIQYCKSNNISTAIVLSSKFHTRRVNYTFRRLFEESGITLILQGAPALTYKEDEWWKYEDGLIMVNNEYIKLGYYFVKF